MDSPSWALQEAIRIVTVLDIVAHCREIDDIDLAGVVEDLDRRDDLDPVDLYLEVLEARSLIAMRSSTTRQVSPRATPCAIWHESMPTSPNRPRGSINAIHHTATK